jgi:hypothetical protein
MIDYIILAKYVKYRALETLVNSVLDIFDWHLCLLTYDVQRWSGGQIGSVMEFVQVFSLCCT